MAKITNIRIFKFKPPKQRAKSLLLGYASFNFEGIMLTGMTIVSAASGTWLNMPGSKGKDGTYRDVFFPMTKELRDEISKKVIDFYENLDTKHKPEQGLEDRRHENEEIPTEEEEPPF